MGATSLLILTLAAIVFSAGGILVSKIFVKGSENPQKGQAYECGVPTVGQTWLQLNVGYYLFALIFLAGIVLFLKQQPHETRLLRVNIMRKYWIFVVLVWPVIYVSLYCV